MTTPHPVLLHICAAADWQAAQRLGELRPGSLRDVGFVHLSTPQQVHLPANRLYAGREDLLLLHIDPTRLEAPVRWEPGVATDPASGVFPGRFAPALRMLFPGRFAPALRMLFPGRFAPALRMLFPGRFAPALRMLFPGRFAPALRMLFPHLYGPLPVATVIAVTPYRPGPDGRFAPLQRST